MTAPTPSFTLDVPFESHTLANGLRVVLSPDYTAPIITVAVYYHVGMRLEPRGRTGFAHLFEHLMFQGSGNMAKMELVQTIQKNGGVLNGTTRFDFTNYFETMPAHTLELALWMESDRMRGPVITQVELDNQRDVVKNEIRVNVLNRPYGGFPWIDMAERAYKNWHNAHNGYGDMVDLDAASLEDVKAFFAEYYAPSNAVLVVTGDFRTDEALAMVERHFADIPSAPMPKGADTSEPRQEEEQRFSRPDRLASQPALAVAYHTPERNTPEFYAMGLLDQVLVQGQDSLLHQELVNRRGLIGEIGGSMSLMGSMFGSTTPMLWTSTLFHDHDTTTETILDAMDTVFERVRQEPIDAATLQRALTKARASYYDQLLGGIIPGMGRADMLACFTLFDNDPALVNQQDSRFLEVTPKLMLATAQEYLRPTNRTVLAVEPGGAS